MPRFAKGSQEAKDYMAQMRANRGVTVKQPVKINAGAAEAGIQQPANDNAPKGKLITQISAEEAEAQLDDMDVQAWVKLHYDQGDFNIQKMAEVLRESTEDIYNRLHVQGVELPIGTYTQ
jgi:hypothetical protein